MNYLSPQDLHEKTKSCEKLILSETLDKGLFNPRIVPLNVKAEDYYLIRKTIRAIPLFEFLSRGKTLGDYLVAAKVHDVLMQATNYTDHVPYLSATVVQNYVGSDLTVEIEGYDSGTAGYSATTGVSGAIQSTSTAATVKATCTPTLITYSPRIAEDLLEDAAGNSDLIQWHIEHAGKQIGLKATGMLIPVLRDAGDGVGTLNAVTTDSGETKFSASATKDVGAAVSANGADGFVSQTIITNGESYGHSLQAFANHTPAKQGFDDCIANMDVYVHPILNELTSGGKYQTLVFDKNNAILTARKAWLTIEKYSNPVKDLAGAVVKGRQDSVQLFRYAICVMTEA